MGDTYYYVRKEKILIGNSNADICIPDMEKEYLVTEKEIYNRDNDRRYPRQDEPYTRPSGNTY